MNARQLSVASLKNGLYKILPGDTLTGIAQEFGISLQKLKEVNGLTAKGLIRPGQKLVIPTEESKIAQ
jgi:LysM repeat protein